ncbi:MAG: hypothetical protein KC766_26400 [Myxococcales bacterium]|nr:hypothetical protein [Myxococcales bacterium]MCB9535897.1 hypothetical protein [Myxococcales bacterium]
MKKRLDEALATLRSAGPIDFVIASATSESLDVVGYIDDARRPCCTLRFSEPCYVQLPWSFSFRVLEVRSVADFATRAPCLPRWELPSVEPAPTELPSFPYKEMADAVAHGMVLFAFESSDSVPSEPPCFVVARSVSVDTRPGLLGEGRLGRNHVKPAR